MAGQPGRSGGKRTGTQGRAYNQRSDLNAHQPILTAPSPQYGEAARLAAAQHAVPLPNAQAPVGGAPAGPPPGEMPMQPGAQDPFAPTARPDEPITAGLPFGAGPDIASMPYQSGLQSAPSDPVAWLKAIYSVAPNNDLLDLISHLAQNQAAQTAGVAPQAASDNW